MKYSFMPKWAAEVGTIRHIRFMVIVVIVLLSFCTVWLWRKRIRSQDLNI